MVTKKSRTGCTIRELAKHVGLSTCTVSKVLNDANGILPIPDATRQRVQKAARELNYVPNVNAQRFFKRRSYVIGLLVPPQEEMGHNAFNDTHFTEILSGIERALAGTQYNLLLLFNRPELRTGNHYHSMFTSGLLDGLLVWGAHRSDSCWKELVELPGPRIFLTSTPDFEPDAPLNFVASDYIQAARGVTEKLMNSGCRRFGWLAGKPDTSIIPWLQNGIEAAGVPALQAIRYSDYTETDGEQLAAELLKTGKFDALVATAPQLARGALHTAERLSSRIRIGCFDGQSITRKPGDRFISALTRDKEIGSAAIEQLIELIEGKDELVQIKVPVAFSE